MKKIKVFILNPIDTFFSQIGWSADDDAVWFGAMGDHWVVLDTGAVQALRGVVTQGEGFEPYW